jgi:hypothetical protein
MTEKKEPPVVDPSPTQPPIPLNSNEYVFPPAEASPKEVLDLKPNLYADAVSGPHPQIPQGTTTMTKLDGTTFEAQTASVDYYVSKGYKVATASSSST